MLDLGFLCVSAVEGLGGPVVAVSISGAHRKVQVGKFEMAVL